MANECLQRVHAHSETPGPYFASPNPTAVEKLPKQNPHNLRDEAYSQNSHRFRVYPYAKTLMSPFVYARALIECPDDYAYLHCTSIADIIL